jgi:hypothetical protein
MTETPRTDRARLGLWFALCILAIVLGSIAWRLVVAFT